VYCCAWSAAEAWVVSYSGKVSVSHEEKMIDDVAIAEEVSEFRQVKQEAADIQLALNMISNLDS
jgi:hypothetical protein